MNDLLTIRQEEERDFDAIRNVVKAAFAGAEHTDGDEHNLVDRLRITDEYIPELSLVAEVDGMIVGHIMFSRIYIGEVEALGLAPLAVIPSFQNKGIGQRLIKTAHRRAKEMGYCCSVVLGSPGYYSKSGYLPASTFDIMSPFGVPPQFYMVYPLNPPLPEGTVRYSDAFGI